MKTQTALQIAESWLKAWNNRDLIALLDHYDDEIEFQSPYVRELYKVPNGILKGKEGLTAYFHKGLASIKELNFKLEKVLVSVDSLTVYYQSVNGQMAAEVMFINDRNLIYKATAYYTTETLQS